MTAHTDNTGVRFGMWLFLYTEIMLFGGLFVLYAAYYHRFPQDFIAGGKELDLLFGAVNTAILLSSSFTVAASIEALKRESKKAALVLLAMTVLFALAFLCIKYVEWTHKFRHGYYPGSEKLLEGPQGITMFFGLYFSLTGLHALHVAIGMGVLLACWVLVLKGGITGSRINILENSGLFWHLVDVVWIFLFPLFYLIL
jgi:cytochrome c oxidase subunit 3